MKAFQISAMALITILAAAFGAPRQAQAQAEAIGYSNLFDLNTQSSEAVGYSNLFDLNTQSLGYTLTYTAGANGSITGTTPQTVAHGSDGTAVEAVSNVGYRFAQWSDGSTDNPRTDTNVTGDISVTASFVALDYPDHYDLRYASRNGSATMRYYEWGVHVTGTSGNGVLKIFKRPNQSSYAEIPGVYVDGSLKALYSQADVGEVYVAGYLNMAVALRAHFGAVYANDLGRVRMIGMAKSSSTGGAEECVTSLYSGGAVAVGLDGSGVLSAGYTPPSVSGRVDRLQPMPVTLVGVSLEEFSAPNQKVAILVMPKKFRWVDGSGLPHIDVSLGRVLDDGANTIEAGHLVSLQANGGGTYYNADAPAIGCGEILSHARVTGRGGKTRVMTRKFPARVYDPTIGSAVIEEYSGAMCPTTISTQSDSNFFAAIQGDLIVDRIETAGEIPALISRGGEVNVGSVATGLGGYPNPHIRKIIGDAGVTGDFMAGVDASGQPNRKGDITFILVGPSASINGRAWIASDTINLRGDPGALGTTFELNPAP